MISMRDLDGTVLQTTPHSKIRCRCGLCGQTSTWEEWGMTTLGTDELIGLVREYDPADAWKDDGLSEDAGQCPRCLAIVDLSDVAVDY